MARWQGPDECQNDSFRPVNYNEPSRQERREDRGYTPSWASPRQSSPEPNRAKDDLIAELRETIKDQQADIQQRYQDWLRERDACNERSRQCGVYIARIKELEAELAKFKGAKSKR